jgi:hypothetical protein
VKDTEIIFSSLPSVLFFKFFIFLSLYFPVFCSVFILFSLSSVKQLNEIRIENLS